MKEKDFIIIEGWMGQLDLTPSELLIYATIYGFTQKEDGKFTAHLRYFKEKFGICRSTAIMSLNHLVELNLLEREPSNYGGRYTQCNIYTAKPPENLPESFKNCTSSDTTGTEIGPLPFKNCTSTGTENEPLPSKNCTSITYITYNDNIMEDNIIDNTITPDGGNSDCESDIDERDLSIDVNIADNTEEQNLREQPPSRELASQESCKSRTQKSTGTKKKTGTKSKKAENAEINARFEKFWEAYPRHIDKAKALKAFTKINPSDELLEQMLNSINEAKKTTQWQTQQYIPYPTTWLNGSRWEDEINPKDIDYDIAHPHSLDNPIDRAVLNGENPFYTEDFWG